ncbi:hypothetical protein A0H81_04511 [Grifola frondosa]|uniref:Chromatin assembly factor 1 subunit A dimerization domain-containing protein n=1 Tax=Grifola frondosa TaxID=5627 RepID=A0A1C7MFJ2_GRIFR|nr:hypothetical protein A0H81_04511 [Grifola frondosa]
MPGQTNHINHLWLKSDMESLCSSRRFYRFKRCRRRCKAKIVKFREMIEQRMKRQEPPLDAIPDEHKPLIAKLVHESDKTLPALSKHIQHELLPEQDDDDDDAASKVLALALPYDVVEQAIKSIASRNNYGLQSLPGGAKVPTGLHIWKWEVVEQLRDWLPKTAREKIENRITERRQAQKDVQVLFESLSEDERNALVGSKHTGKTSLKSRFGMKASDEIVVVESSDHESRSSQQLKNKRVEKVQRTDNDESGQQNGSPGTKGPSRSRKSVDSEKIAKEKERLEKKAAKFEKDMKEKAAQDKSRSLMANFFGKARPQAPVRSSSAAKDPDPSVAGPSSVQSEFQKAFKPFVVKKDAELAPINWFRDARTQTAKGKYRTDGNVIIIDDEEVRNAPEDVQMQDALSYIDVGRSSIQERLWDSFSALPPSIHRPCRRSHRSRLKTYCPHHVRTIIAQLNEAEISGDDAQVRSLLALLRNRSLLPAKVLIFASDARPGYFGTWTRNSHEIGPRAPFARDVAAIDYGYDSGEEWEEEGGEADDVVEDAEEEDGGDEGDSDLDDWLVDDDEVEDPGTPVEDRARSPDGLPSDLPVPPKRKGDDATKQNKKRKIVVPLVPFTKGPCWESTVGRCKYEPFHPYRIELFNDTPFPINPFTFVSTSVEESVKPATGKSASDPLFAVPALPARFINVQPAILSAPGPSSAPVKRTPLMPKTPFPNVHLPLLFARIDSLATTSLHCIVETVHHELQAHRVKKNAIEAKVREIAEKSKERKVWVVKPDARVRGQ